MTTWRKIGPHAWICRDALVIQTACDVFESRPFEHSKIPPNAHVTLDLAMAWVEDHTLAKLGVHGSGR